MYFDFEDGHPDIAPVGSAISWREGVLLSIIAHLLGILGLVLMPFVPESAEAVRARELALTQRAQDRAQRFVFVQPRLDTPAPQPKPDVDASDKDRVARTPLQMPNAANPLPFARGNTPERVEAPPTDTDRTRDRRAEETERAGIGRGSEASAAPPDRTPLPETSTSALRMPNTEGRGAEPGGLGRALRNLQHYIDQESFDNQQGGAAGMGPLQFDTKGVEFGPWVRRFVAQIKRNWFIPYAAMSLRGHVILTFYVHKDGTLTEIQVRGPSTIDAFNNAAYNALAASNPTQPLPAEYPSDKAFFTVTFYYNETPR